MIHLAPFLTGFLLEAVWIVPVNTILALYCLRHRAQVWRYTAYAFGCSLIGSVLGYVLGAWGIGIVSYFPRIANAVNGWVAPLAHTSRMYQLGTIALGALLPIPFKLITIGAGILAVPLIPFLCAVAGARFIRFFAIAGAIWLWGDWVARVLDRVQYLLVPFAICISLFGLFILSM